MSGDVEGICDFINLKLTKTLLTDPTGSSDAATPPPDTPALKPPEEHVAVMVEMSVCVWRGGGAKTEQAGRGSMGLWEGKWEGKPKFLLYII